MRLSPIDLHSRANDAMKKKNRMILAFGILMILLCPFKTTVAPQISLRLVDQQGSPVSDATAYRMWRHYTLDRESHFESKLSDSNGTVTFEEKAVWSNIVMHVFGALGNIWRMGVHASFGPSWNVTASKKEVGNGTFPPNYGDPTDATIVLQP